MTQAAESVPLIAGAHDFPIEEHWATVEGGRIRYLQAGSGFPLVLLHGLMGYSFSWRFAIPVLAKHFTVYALDMLGAGFSDRPRDLDCTFRGCARRLLCFANRVGISAFDLLGTSHGGAVTMMAAALASESDRTHIRRLVLVAPVNPWSSHGTGLARFLSNEWISFFFRGLAPRATFAHKCILARLYGDRNKIASGTLEGYSRPLERPGSLEYGLRILTTWGEDLRDLESSLEKIVNIPTLLIWGSRDRAVDPASAQPLGSRFRNCRTIILEGVGHLPYEEAPDQFNDAVIDFLQNKN
jgi:pimeloyl-ACP methyl ester carboxylesterase